MLNVINVIGNLETILKGRFISTGLILTIRCLNIICEKGFHRKTELNRHTVVHTGVKSYHCVRCGKAFTNKENCKKHEEKMLEGVL